MDARQTLGGRYVLLTELGSGGMAVVWRAQDLVLGRLVAVKLLAGEYADDPQSRSRIRAEARAAAALSHPNIAQVYDYGESTDGDSRTPYVVMELINGPTLRQRITNGPIPPRTVFRICSEVAAGLAAAHADGLVHRDVKMSNIIVTAGGAKVVDFGIAAAMGPGVPDDMVVGTPAYLAPERLTGDTVQPASDIYALGVMLFRLLSGYPPWSAESTTQMLRAHVYLEPQPLPKLHGVPPTITDLVTRCLLKDPAARPSAAEVSTILADSAEASVTVATSPSADGEAVALPAGAGDDSAGSSRLKVLVIGVVSAILFVGSLLGWLALGDSKPSAQGPTANVAPSDPTSSDRAVTLPTAAPKTAPALPTPVRSARSVPISRAIKATPSPVARPTTKAPLPVALRGDWVRMPGGSAYAECVDGMVTLSRPQPVPGFDLKELDAGPVPVAKIIFADRSQNFQATVTCVAGVPRALLQTPGSLG